MKSFRILIENAIMYVVENPFLFRYKKQEPSLLALNINWFTNCSWLEQLVAFDQIDKYIAHKL